MEKKSNSYLLVNVQLGFNYWYIEKEEGTRTLKCNKKERVIHFVEINGQSGNQET